MNNGGVDSFFFKEKTRDYNINVRMICKRKCINVRKQQ